MKLLKRLIAAVLMATVMMTMLCSCTTNTTQIKDTLSEFEYACHNLDVDAILNCIDPDVAAPIRLIIDVYSVVTEQDSEDVLDQLVEKVFGSNFDSIDSDELLSHITITDPKIKIKKKKAAITCKMNVEIAGDTYSKETTINMRKVDDRWYIAGIEFPDDLEE